MTPDSSWLNCLSRILRLFTRRNIVHLLPPPTRSMTFQHRLDKACGAVAVIEGGQHYRLCSQWRSFADPSICVSDQIEKCVRPGFLVSTRKMDVAENIWRYEPGVFRHHAIWLIMTANPKLILFLLLPLQ